MLAALGLSQWGGWPDRYQQALAQPTRRKLALLVGINQYPDTVIDMGRAAPLRGCVTDVRLQQELLIHRFGFQPADIVTLTDAQATRQAICEAFVEHLCQQAQPGDVVIFHFSGYGSQVRLANQQKLSRSLVPVDGRLPTEAQPHLNDISEATLKQLLKLLNTQQVTTVLDAGFVDAEVSLVGSLRVRARPTMPTGEPAPALSLPPGVAVPDVPSRFPGILLRAAVPQATVIERQWDGFDAGAFTYVLSQYLWSAVPPVTVRWTVERASETLNRWGGGDQVPDISGSRDRGPDLPIYQAEFVPASQADGVVTQVNGDGREVKLWLGGLPAPVLKYYGPQSVMSLVTAATEGEPSVEVRLKLRSRSGLVGRAQLLEGASVTPSPGQRVYEAVRVLPRDIDLVVALDNQLERIERVDATSALAALSFVSSTSATELPADCLLGKLAPPAESTLTASLTPAKPSAQSSASSRKSTRTAQQSSPPAAEGKQGYGLFSPTRSLIPGTLASQDEAIKSAVNRLTPKLQALLAIKMLRLTQNQSSSRLAVRVNLEMISPQEKLLLRRETTRSPQPLPKSRLASLMKGDETTVDIPVGSRVRYRLFNFGEVPLYYALITLDPQERLSAFCPPPSSRPIENPDTGLPDALSDAGIPPGESMLVPQLNIDWGVEAPRGPVETYVICSTVPLQQSLKALLKTAASSSSQRISPLSNPLDVVQAILADIHQAAGDAASVTDAYALDVRTWATLSFTYQAV
ncbi:caspase family protein [Romeria aff. gracilis LEGE 07310]|uniref:Caspase family protein n=1 Tax=Vasconcelosia minhoensis LEGE 07310 TaxID=915328 RepID=A0A8J7AGS3_9CYAN|nr:caspase family protein [Romeria gracilis]MBE9078866.1 caspase family protein [Romeria aff. gracilis LEGE 07310]